MVRGPVLFTRPCLRRLGEPIFRHPASACNFSSTTSQNAVVARAAIVAKTGIAVPVDQSPPTKPKSARPVETRKSQMIRTYTSMLRTAPLVLFFQHSNLTANEWAAVRRELRKALDAVVTPVSAPGTTPLNMAPEIKLQVLRTNMLNVALKLVEFYSPELAATLPTTPRSTKGPLVHDLSQAAYDVIKTLKPPTDSTYAHMEPLLVGPLAGLVMPAVSPAHLAAALRVLSPVVGKFPAPSRKKNPGWHDPVCQNGLAKLTLVGGRVEGKIFDEADIGWIGGIEGGMDGLRAQLVGMLQGAGLCITAALEGGSKALWLSLESRRTQLEASGESSKAE